MLPATKATTTDINIPEMMANALPELMYSAKLPALFFQMIYSETATAAPNSSKTNDTVVEVGSPSVLNISSKMTSVIMTAKKSIMIFGKENILG